MLKFVSRFVLEVLPYVELALIAAVVVPGFLNSQFHGRVPAGITSIADSTVNPLELVRRDYAAFGAAVELPGQPASSAQR